MIPSKFDQLMRCFKGGGGGNYKPPKPPNPSTAADEVAKRRILDRQTMSRGFGQQRFALLSSPLSDQVKSLLGQ